MRSSTMLMTTFRDLKSAGNFKRMKYISVIFHPKDVKNIGNTYYKYK